MSATIHATPPIVPLSRKDVNSRCRALGWSQNELARRIRKNPGLVSRVLAGKATSSVVWGRIGRALARAERSKPGPVEWRNTP